MIRVIRDVEIILPGKLLKGSIVFSDRIEKIAPDVKAAGTEEFDGSGMYLAPGFIDIHIHGAGGYDTMDDVPGAINEISKSIIKSGVTSFLPTTMSMPAEDIKRSLNNIKIAISEGTAGARVLGANVEGPFINKNYRGAQKLENIQKIDLEIIKDYLDIIKLITIAPEIEGSEELIKYLNKERIIVAAGHSEASYEQILTARKWGVSHLTHLFNAMTGLHHRQPGMVGAALKSDLNCELIADFIHVHPAVIEIIFKAKSTKEIFLITDQMRAGSMEEGIYELGGQRVTVKNGQARLENGSLAGSVLTLDQAVRKDRKSTRLNSSHVRISYAVFCLKKKTQTNLYHTQ